ncbi:MAG: fasciclin domain-containing protein [Gemmatimonas sp.]
MSNPNTEYYHMQSFARSFKTIASLAVAAALTVGASAAAAQPTVEVGGMSMYPAKDIIDNAVNSKDHTTLVAAVKAAGLVDALKGKGPFTVFAPVNSAFAALPAGTVETLLMPENKAKLTSVLTYHVVAGNYDGAALEKAIKAGMGKATLKTLAGGMLTARKNGARNIQIVDASGNVANISTYDVKQSNGVIQVIDRVLLPGM